METLKNEIKKLAESQKNLKNQRKTDHLIGERTIPAWEAAYRHLANKHKLRIMYAAYGSMKGKKYSEIENHYPEESHPLNEYTTQILELVEKYATEETVRSDK